MIIVNPIAEQAFGNEPPFYLFKHRELYCAMARSMMVTGNWCGYVAIDKQHPFFGKGYGDSVVVKDLSKVKFNNNYLGLLNLDPDLAAAGVIDISLYINVHCGITWADDYCPCIDKEIFPELWWLGFDTAHAGDAWTFQNVINDMTIPMNFSSDIYRDFQFTRWQTRKLAEQLADLQPKRSDLAVAAYNYYCKKQPPPGLNMDSG
jgi:hypothetical protein